MRIRESKVIITCALTGGIHGKEAPPHLPEQPDEIVAQGSQRGMQVLRYCMCTPATPTARTP